MKHTRLPFALLLLLIAHSCKENPTAPTQPDPKRTIALALADSSLHEIWLRLSLPDSLSGRSVKLFRNDTLRYTFDLSTRDTLVMDSGLALGTPYTYRVLRTDNTRTLDSAETTTATMPTTSHAFVWRVDTLGLSATSLNDVCVINDTCIWVVGQINGYQYNAARFDGHQWHYESLGFAAFGTANLSYGEINAVWGFSPNDVWMFSSAGSYLHWNGSEWKSQYVSERSGSVLKLWGTSSNDLYLVGTNGSITYYNGSVWRRVESGTTTIIQDVWGSIDKATGDTLVLASSNDPLLLRLRKFAPATRYSWSGGSLRTVWFRNHLRLFAAGGGIWHRLPNGTWHNQSGLPTVFRERIRGRGENDVFAVGHFGFLAHYNGATWQVYPELAVADVWESLDYNASTVCAVGFLGGRGVVAIGRR